MKDSDENLRKSHSLFLQCRKADLSYGCTQVVNQALGVDSNFADLVNDHERGKNHRDYMIGRQMHNGIYPGAFAAAQDLVINPEKFRSFILTPKCFAREMHDVPLGVPVATLIFIDDRIEETGHVVAVINPANLSRDVRRVLKKNRQLLVLEPISEDLFLLPDIELMRSYIKTEVDAGNDVLLISVFKNK
jgi:hypothetical protein